MGIREVLWIVATVVLLSAWSITYYTNNMLIKQNEKLYNQTKACYEVLKGMEEVGEGE